jgi:hypothetical protein
MRISGSYVPETRKDPVSPELEKKIIERRKEAGEKRIAEKVDVVISALGKDWDNNEVKALNGYHASLRHIFSIGMLSMKRGLTLGLEHKEVLYDSHLVFSTDGGKVCSFAPGPWERELDLLCERALVVLKEQNDKISELERALEEQRENNARRKWGL